MSLLKRQTPSLNTANLLTHPLQVTTGDSAPYKQRKTEKKKSPLPIRKRKQRENCSKPFVTKSKPKMSLRASKKTEIAVLVIPNLPGKSASLVA
ncbi:hypothetical protein BJ508DRAFT_364356 [Ascobolus immersus RN42]|uniref:Uncharacterized protein n=1 Tax=Ascobolus immersus RN42 TaxID=1160509 RepID=A0A3N4HWT9_ASCIM|nr:hypothetical protein BJ508DRAFT_364356 [Ascobolus immersus RN42]